MKKIYTTIIICCTAVITAFAQSPCQISLTSASGTDAQTVCINTAITDITYAASGTGASISPALPEGLSSSFSAGVYTISGTSSVSVTYNYTITTTGGCSPDSSAIGIIIIDALPYASAGGSQTICSGASTMVSGASAGLNSVFGYGSISWASNGLGNISNATTLTPTYQAAADDAGNTVVLTMTVTSTNSCASQTASATYSISVLPALTATLQVSPRIIVCQNSPAQLVLTATGKGTPPYTFTYKENVTTKTATTTGGNNVVIIPLNTSKLTYVTYRLNNIQDANCSTPISIPADTLIVDSCSKSPCQINLTSANGTDAQTVCINTAITPITYTLTGTNASISATLPTGVSGSYSAGVFTISGTPTTSGTYNYTVTSTDTCATNPSATGTISVNALPTATITGTVSKCLNDPNPYITFTGANGTAPYLFTYKLNGAANQTLTTTGGNNSATIVVPTSVGGTFTYSLINVQDENSCSRTQNGSAVVTISPLGATISGATAICQYTNSPIITFSGSGGTVPYTFTYDLNGVPSPPIVSSPAGTATLYVGTSAAGTFAYHLSSVQDANSLSCVSVGSATVTVNALPTATISITSPSTVCQNSASPIISISGSNGKAPYQFTYIENGGTYAIATTMSNIGEFLVPTNVITTYTYNLVSVKDANGCSQQQTGDVKVTVDSSKVTTSILSTNETSVGACNGYLEAVAKGTAPFTYLWSDSAAVNSPYRHHECAGTYSLTVTDSSGCSASAKAYVGSDSVPVATVNPLKITVTTSNATSVALCNGTAVATVTGGVPTYTINFAGSTTTGATLNIPNLCAGFYTINATDAQSHTASFTFVVGSPATTYTTAPNPVYADSTITNALLSTAIPNCSIDYSANAITSIKIKEYAYVSNDSVSVTWNIYQGSTIKTQKARYQISLPGVYKFVLALYCTNRASGSVTASDETYISNRSTGITAVELNNTVIYPNPFSNKLTVVLDKAASIKITDLSGKEIYSTKVNAGISVIETGNFNTGVYLITISDETGSVTKKLVRE
jgi:hypothetical protein